MAWFLISSSSWRVRLYVGVDSTDEITSSLSRSSWRNRYMWGRRLYFDVLPSPPYMRSRRALRSAAFSSSSARRSLSSCVCFLMWLFIPSTSSMPKPVARIVTLIFSPSSGSRARPHLNSNLVSNLAIKSFTSFISSIIRLPLLLPFSPLNDMLRRIFFELKISLSLSKGEFRASSMAFFTRPSPSP